MKLIVGLGNYPKKYHLTRHNIGFLLVDYLQNIGNFDKWKESKKDICDISKGILFKVDCILIKPNTYMNLSGEAVIKVMRFYKICANDLIVVHDDIDLAFGNVKFTQSKNSAGHNGVKSINSVIHDVYNRIRVGVGRPDNPEYDVADYVLSKFTDIELKEINDEVNEKVANEIFSILTKTC